jgi:hypothetical protein
MESLASYFEPPPRTSFSPTELSQRRRNLRPVVLTILAVSVVLLLAAAVRLAFRSHDDKASAPSGQLTPVEQGAPGSSAPPSDEATAASEPSVQAEPATPADAHHKKTSLSHRSKKAAGPHAP